jgi:Domain of unknown function (DUF4878)
VVAPGQILIQVVRSVKRGCHFQLDAGLYITYKWNMKIYILILVSIVVFISCKNQTGYNKAEDAEDAGREFIRASLDGNYDKASFYMLKDPTNTNAMLLQKWKKDYDKKKEEDKVSYKQAAIIALRIEPLNDSTVNYVYTNSFEVKDTTTIKVVKVNNEWLVDLKDIH